MKKNKIINKLRQKFRLFLYKDQTYESVWDIRFSRLGMLLMSFLLFVFIAAITVAAIVFTPLKEFIPGYPTREVRKSIVENAHQLDSLEHQIKLRDQYFQNIKEVIADGEISSPVLEKSQNVDNEAQNRYDEIDFPTSQNDSVLRAQIDQAEQYNLTFMKNRESKPDLSQIHFFPPVRGLVTNSMNSTDNHFGTDIVSGPNEVVSATLEGTVTMAAWTLETGYEIRIQHDNDLISVYKHNSEILKKVGNFVEAGEAIAIVGNSGELTTGPHLHFELWHNGKPLNPEYYIHF